MPKPIRDHRFQVAQFDSKSAPLRAQKETPPPPNPNHPPPLGMFLLAGVLVIALGTAIAYWIRRSAYRAWQEYARRIGGEFVPKDRLSPRLVSGQIGERPILLETATSHEDEAGYYHTRGRLPLKNSGSFILGLRRKSFLEATQTRKETPTYSFDDPDFERHFFLYCNDPDNLPAVLSSDVRQELLRYPDVEIYIHMGEMEWRRAGEQADVKVIVRLTDMVLEMAQTIDSLPSRGRSLTQCLADEKLIEKGV